MRKPARLFSACEKDALMEYPDIIEALPEADIPFPATQVKTHALPSDHGLLIFFEFLQDFDLPAHSHGGQWGTVLDGSMDLTIGGETRTYTPGMTYNIPAGVIHSARIRAGAKVMDFFEEADRYGTR
ncbi:MAG: cupin domain-containing protein [Paracoccaceae bacterium]